MSGRSRSPVARERPELVGRTSPVSCIDGSSANAIDFGIDYKALADAVVAGGPDGLLVVTDFDQTLTKFRGRDRAPGLQCHDVILSHVGLEQPGLRQRMAPLIEWHDMPEEQRMRVCQGDQKARVGKSRWFADTFAQICVDFQLAEQARDCVARSNIQLRGGLAETFKWLEAHGVPLVIVSAGLSQVIQAIFDAVGLHLPSTARLVANDLLEAQARVTARTKEGALALVPDFAALVAGRRHVLLLGDKPSDCAVAAGLPEGSVVLKVGFMNEGPPVQTVLDAQLQHFDVVLSDDADMTFVNELLRRVASGADAATVQ